MGEIRAFIAIDIPCDIEKALKEAIRILGNQLDKRDVRWVKTANIHLTLRFLGNVKEDRLADLYQGLDAAAEGQSSYSLDLDVIGCFPNPRRPRVIWIGLAGHTDRLRSLHKAIESMLAPFGWETEGRRYNPHLTLGRVKRPSNVVEARLPWGSRLSVGRIDVKSIHLIESQLLPAGAVYTVRHSSFFPE